MTPQLPDLLPWSIGGGNLAGQETGREHLSHTALSNLLACPQKYAYQYVDRIEPIRRAESLTLGKAYQLAIEHGDATLAGSSILQAQDFARSQEESDRMEVNAAIATAAAGLYLNRWPKPKPSRHLQPHSIREYEYRVRLRNPHTGSLSRTFDLLGYADEIVHVPSEDNVLHGDAHWLLIENKLVGQITESWVKRLPLDRQIALASYGIWRATGKPVREVSYRFMRKPSIRQRKGESTREFCDRLTEDYATRPEFYIHEETWRRSTEDLVRTEVELWAWAKRLRAERSEPVWTRNTATCTEYGGCPFIPLCLGEDAEGMYRRKESHAAAS